jgi:hypothetical protein
VAGYRLGTVGERTDTMSMPATPPGLQVLELVLTDLNGQPQNFAQWRGKVLIVNYWATWCQPCREEMPGFPVCRTSIATKASNLSASASMTADKIIEFQKDNPRQLPLADRRHRNHESSAKTGQFPQAFAFHRPVSTAMGRLARASWAAGTRAGTGAQLKELLSR